MEYLHVRVRLRKNSGKRLKLQLYDPVNKRDVSLRDMVAAKNKGTELSYNFDSIDGKRAEEFLLSYLKEAENLAYCRMEKETVFLNNVIKNGGFTAYIKSLEDGICLH